MRVWSGKYNSGISRVKLNSINFLLIPDVFFVNILIQR